MGFPRQEYRSGLPSPPPGDLPNPGTEPILVHWQADSSPPSHQGRRQEKEAGSATQNSTDSPASSQAL